MAYTNYNFKVAQSIRLALILLVLGIWVTNAFIFVRSSFFYMSFWSNTLLFFALCLIFVSAGRQVVEKKLTLKIIDESQKSVGKSNDNSLLKESVD